MIEEVGNLWAIPADARCITTNGDVNTKGKAIMGSGCALEARGLYLGIDEHFGKLLQSKGHHVYPLWEDDDYVLLSFPTKYNWWKQPSDIDLIVRSCHELMELMDPAWQRVLVPRPGCGAGQLRWEDVKPVIAPILDDRVVIVTYGPVQQSGASGRS